MYIFKNYTYLLRPPDELLELDDLLEEPLLDDRELLDPDELLEDLTEELLVLLPDDL